MHLASIDCPSNRDTTNKLDIWIIKPEYAFCKPLTRAIQRTVAHHTNAAAKIYANFPTLFRPRAPRPYRFGINHTTEYQYRFHAFWLVRVIPPDTQRSYRFAMVLSPRLSMTTVHRRSLRPYLHQSFDRTLGKSHTHLMGN